MRKTDDQLQVRFERGVRWVLEQYRSEGARALVNKVRLAVAQLLTPPDTTSRSGLPRKSAPRPDREAESHDVLAGLCGGVALRDLNLVDSLLAELEGMEANEGDPDALARLYQLDHLAARLRRNAENLRVLAGHDAGSAASAALPLVDVIRAAMSSIEQYPRIEIGRVAALAVVDFAADDLSRLLAELLDNATSHSPPTSQVTVSAHLTEQASVLLRVEDAGISLPADRLEALNARLSTDPRLGSTDPSLGSADPSVGSADPSVGSADQSLGSADQSLGSADQSLGSADLRLDRGSIEQMGLAVVRRLAGKHGIRVRLEKRATHGTTAAVLLPANLLCEVPTTPWFADSPVAKRSQPAPVRVGASSLPSPRRPSELAEQAERPPASRTTRNGLPRRVPQSMREFAAFASAEPDVSEDPASGQGREQLMTDLGDFSEGEQAARGAQRPTAGGDREQGSSE